MRPDAAAFRELDTLVRNLTDQLAGYRRRALSGEARARELEQEGDAMTIRLQHAHAELEAAVESRDHALAAAREATSSARAAREALDHMQQAAATEESLLMAAASESQGPPSEAQQLRARLAEARDRTVQLVERVRFLRQQIAQGVEK